VDQCGHDCVERGYLLLPATQRQLNLGEFEAAQASAALAATLAEQFRDRDLLAFARNLQGRALLRLGKVDQGLPLMDDALVAVSTGELSPVMTGLIYCSAIAACQRIFAFDRTREWTAALAGWCDSQPQLVMFQGHCLVHRAQILQLVGAWPEALVEARRAVERCVGDFDGEALGQAHYEQGEIHRLRGEVELAETAYRNASRCGVEPHPGLALLRLTQGDHTAAASALRRVLSTVSDPLGRARHLPAYLEILLVAGALEEARAAAAELEAVSASFRTAVLAALTQQAHSAVHLAAGNPSAVLAPLSEACAVWRSLGASVVLARLRMMRARACIGLDDIEGAQLELEAGRSTLAALGARPSLDEVDALTATLPSARARGDAPHGLTPRELQVLRLVAAGLGNKAIARELAVSGKTVDRHLSNIFVKIDVSSRSAAAAFAYEHRLV
jgi:DNA-binding CsgD family transcriptional regulator/tetratricopeptide (TPR) repeat protein